LSDFNAVIALMALVCGVAISCHLSGRRSLAGGISLPCARAMVDGWLWVTVRHVGHPTRSTQLSIPPGSRNRN